MLNRILWDYRFNFFTFEQIQQSAGREFLKIAWMFSIAEWIDWDHNCTVLKAKRETDKIKVPKFNKWNKGNIQKTSQDCEALQNTANCDKFRRIDKADSS